MNFKNFQIFTYFDFMLKILNPTVDCFRQKNFQTGAYSVEDKNNEKYVILFSNSVPNLDPSITGDTVSLKTRF